MGPYRMQKQRKVSPKSPIAAGWKMMERLSRAYCFQSMPACGRSSGTHMASIPTGRAAKETQNGHLQSISPRKPPMAGYSAVPTLIVAPTMPMTLGRSASL